MNRCFSLCGKLCCPNKDCENISMFAQWFINNKGDCMEDVHVGDVIQSKYGRKCREVIEVGANDIKLAWVDKKGKSRTETITFTDLFNDWRASKKG